MLINYTREVLPVWSSFGRHFVVRLVMCLLYKSGHKMRNTPRRATFRNSSFKTHFQMKLDRLDG